MQLLDDGASVLELPSAVAVRFELRQRESELAQLDRVEARLSQGAHAVAARDQLGRGEPGHEQLLGGIACLAEGLGADARELELACGGADGLQVDDCKLGVDEILHRIAGLAQLEAEIAADLHLVRGVAALTQLLRRPRAVPPLLYPKENLALAQLGRSDVRRRAAAHLLGRITASVLQHVARVQVDASARAEGNLGGRVALLLEPLRRVPNIFQRDHGRTRRLELHERRTRLLNLLRRVASLHELPRLEIGPFERDEVVARLPHEDGAVARHAHAARCVARLVHLLDRVARVARLLRRVARVQDARALVASLLHVLGRVARVAHHLHREDQSLAQVHGCELGGAQVGDQVACLAELERLVPALTQLVERVRLRVLHLLRRVPAVLELARIVPNLAHLLGRDLCLPHLLGGVPEVLELQGREADGGQLLGLEEALLELFGGEADVEQLARAEAHIPQHLGTHHDPKVSATAHALGHELRDRLLPVLALDAAVARLLRVRKDLDHRRVRDLELGLARLRVAVLAQQLEHGMHLLALGAVFGEEWGRHERGERLLRPRAQLEHRDSPLGLLRDDEGLERLEGLLIGLHYREQRRERRALLPLDGRHPLEARERQVEAHERVVLAEGVDEGDRLEVRDLVRARP